MPVVFTTYRYQDFDKNIEAHCVRGKGEGYFLQLALRAAAAMVTVGSDRRK